MTEEQTIELLQRLYRKIRVLAPIDGVDLTGPQFKSSATPAQMAAAQAVFDAEPKIPKRPKPLNAIITWLESLNATQQRALILRVVAHFIRERIPYFPREQGLGFDAEESDV